MPLILGFGALHYFLSLSPCLSSTGFSRVRSFEHFSLAKSISNRREVASQVFCSCKEDFLGIFPDGFWWDIGGVVCCRFCSCCLNLPGGGEEEQEEAMAMVMAGKEEARVEKGSESLEEAIKLIEEFRLPGGLLPLENVVECGYYIKESGYVWITQKKAI